MSFTIDELYWSHRDKMFANRVGNVGGIPMKDLVASPGTDKPLEKLLDDYDSKALLLAIPPYKGWKDNQDRPELRVIPGKVAVSFDSLWQNRNHSDNYLPVQWPFRIRGYYDLQEVGLIKMCPRLYLDFKERNKRSPKIFGPAQYPLGERYEEARVIGVRKENILTLGNWGSLWTEEFFQVIGVRT